MQGRRRLPWFVIAFTVFGLLAIATPVSAASKEQVLRNFLCPSRDCPNGAYPLASLIFDGAGNLYGTTSSGGVRGNGGCGNNGCGLVFELSPGAGGTWNETVLYTFCTVSDCTDGAFPTSSLIFDSVGNLYGTTNEGGAYVTGCGGFGCGTVFELSPSTGGAWTETVLHSFGTGSDGALPVAGLIFDAAGNLYGTSVDGGTSGTGCYGYGCGTVFELSPSAGGTWTESILYNFCSASGCADGASPRAGLIFDPAGNLYGTTYQGGAYVTGCSGHGCGTVFELSPSAGSAWTETVAYSFHGKDGRGPYAGLVFDAVGNLYGTTSGGSGSSRCKQATCGTVFELTQVNGKWNEKVLHLFAEGTGGNQPYASLVFDTVGNLYGTTLHGGVDGCKAHGHGCGTAFRLAPRTNGKWVETVLHSFKGGPTDGAYPNASLIFDTTGNLYGTTVDSGYYNTCSTTGAYQGCGSVFEITP
jgi:uncharacterized repeat protein (TIGR03803 family)